MKLNFVTDIPPFNIKGSQNETGDGQDTMDILLNLFCNLIFFGELSVASVHLHYIVVRYRLRYNPVLAVVLLMFFNQR